MTGGELLRQEGRQETELRILHRQLQLRFGPLPDDVVEQLESSSFEQRERWLDGLLTASSLDELFAEDAR